MPESLFYTATAGFEAARRLDAAPAGHRTRRVHGHSFRARLRAALPAAWAGFPGGEAGRLAERLAACVSPLDYTLLNDQIEQPTDEHLARWLRARMDLPGVELFGIASTRDSGVDLDRDARAHVWRRYRFEAAHRLPRVPAGHKCGAMHGHSFEVVLHALHDPGNRAPGADADRLDACWRSAGARLHLACLNDIPGLENPTSEMIAGWIWATLKPELPKLSCVTVFETAACGSRYDGARYGIWKEFTTDSATRLNRAPRNDRRHGIHGHTYALRLHVSAPLDAVLGWTMDFGDVQALFRPAFLELDHRPLYEIPDLEDGDAASIVRWVRSRVEPTLPRLARIDLVAEDGGGAILSWNTAGSAPAV